MTVVIASFLCVLAAWLPPGLAVPCSLLAGAITNAASSRPRSGLPALLALIAAAASVASGTPPDRTLPWAWLALGATVLLVLLIALGGPARRAAEVQGRFFVDRLGVRMAQLGAAATDDILVLTERLRLSHEERWLASLEGRLRLAQLELLVAALGALGVAAAAASAGAQSLIAIAHGGHTLCCATILLAPASLKLLTCTIGGGVPGAMSPWWVVSVPWRLWMKQGVRNVRLSARMVCLPELRRWCADERSNLNDRSNGHAERRATRWLLQRLNRASLITWWAAASPEELAALGALSDRERTTTAILRMLRYLDDDGLPWFDRRRVIAAMANHDDALLQTRVPVRERVRLALVTRGPEDDLGCDSTVELPPLMEAVLNDCDVDEALPPAMRKELTDAIRRSFAGANSVTLVVGARIRPLVVDAMRSLPSEDRRDVVTRLEQTRAAGHNTVTPASRTFDSGPLESRGRVTDAAQG